MYEQGDDFDNWDKFDKLQQEFWDADAEYYRVEDLLSRLDATKAAQDAADQEREQREARETANKRAEDARREL